jgi:hypothetical protein
VERAMSTNMAKENETRHILHRANKRGTSCIEQTNAATAVTII